MIFDATCFDERGDKQKRQQLNGLPVNIGFKGQETFTFDLAKAGSVLIAGASGQGKTNCLNAMITSLLYSKKPDELKLVLIDPKRCEFDVYAPIAKHYLAALEAYKDHPILTDTQSVEQTLQGLNRLIERRFEQLIVTHTPNVWEYNHKLRNHLLNNEDGRLTEMPYIVVVIDEFGELLLNGGKETVEGIIHIAQLGRQVGVCIVIVTQRLTPKFISGKIKAAFLFRIAFRVAAEAESRLILDWKGAEEITACGDMICSDGMEFQRLHCTWVDRHEIENLVDSISKRPDSTGVFIIP